MSDNKDLDNQFDSTDEMLDESGYEDGGDDFDPEGLGDADNDADFEDEDWESYDEDDGDDAGAESAQAGSKGKSRLVTLLIGGVAAVAVLLVAFNMIGGGADSKGSSKTQRAAQAGGTQQTAQRLTSPSLQANTPTAQRDVIYGRTLEEQQVKTEIAQEGGFLHDPAALKELEDTAGQITDEAYAEGRLDEYGQIKKTADGADMDGVKDKELPMPVPAQDNVLTPLPSEVSTMSAGLPRAQDLKRGGEDKLQEVVPDRAVAGGSKELSVPAQETAPAPSSESAPVPDAVLSAAPAEQLTSPAAPAPAMVPEAELQAVRAALTAAQSELQALRKQAARADELQNTVKQLELALEAQQKASPKDDVSSPAMINAGGAPVSTAPHNDGAAASASRPASSVREAAPATGTRWVLKSARPGQAMIAQGNSNEIRSVAVGDTVRGLGRIVSIARGAQGWVVEGTEGRVTQ